jgi:hypothetical protein
MMLTTVPAWGGIVVLVLLAGLKVLPAAPEDALRRAVTFYAGFDEAAQGDFGGGDLQPWTRYEHEQEKGRHPFARGFDAGAVRIATGKGVHGGALEFTRPLPRRGMLFFPARDKLALKKSGWGGAVSVWLQPAPDTPFCDPVYITQRRWNDGALWFDYNHDRRGDLRMGAYPVLAEGQKPPGPDDPHPSMLRLKENALKPDAWNHVVMTWANADTGKTDGRASLYLAGKLVGEVKDLDLRLDWDLDQTRIFLGFLYVGLLDELALFNRPLTAEDVCLLRAKPGLLASLKK